MFVMYAKSKVGSAVAIVSEKKYTGFIKSEIGKALSDTTLPVICIETKDLESSISYSRLLAGPETLVSAIGFEDNLSILNMI